MVVEGILSVLNPTTLLIILVGLLVGIDLWSPFPGLLPPCSGPVPAHYLWDVPT